MTTLEAVAPTAPHGRRNAGQRDAQEPMLRAARLKKHFPLKGSLFGRTSAIVQAVDDVAAIDQSDGREQDVVEGWFGGESIEQRRDHG